MKENRLFDELRAHLAVRAPKLATVESGVDGFAYGSYNVEWLELKVKDFAVRIYWPGDDELRILARWNDVAASSDEYFIPSRLKKDAILKRTVAELGELVSDLLASHESARFSRSKVEVPTGHGMFTMNIED